MTRLAPAAALLALGLAAGALAARAQDRARPPAPFEYRVLAMDPADYADKADYARVRQQYGGDGAKADAPFREYVLNTLAEEGWELVALERPRPNLVHYYLRRPRL